MYRAARRAFPCELHGRALLANAFVAETSRADDCDPEFGFFEGDQLAFLHAYAENCTPGESLGFPLDIWPAGSIKTGSCNPPQGFTLDIFSDDDPFGGRTATVLVTAETLPGGNRAVHTLSTLLDLEDEDDGPLDVGTVYDLVTEIGPEDQLVKRRFGENTMVVFDMFFGERFFIEYEEGSEVIFNASNTINGAHTETYCVAGEGDKDLDLDGGMEIREADFFIGSTWIVAEGLGEMSLRLDVNFSGDLEPRSILRFETFVNQVFPASFQEEPSLLGLMLMMSGDGDDWCDEDEDDGIQNCQDPCPDNSHPESLTECDFDDDTDGILNCEDPCPDNPHPECLTYCDLDDDGDGALNCDDPCPDDSEDLCGGIAP